MGVEPIYVGWKPTDLTRSPTEHLNLVDRVGFEPTKPEGGGFTIRLRWPLAYLSEFGGTGGIRTHENSRIKSPEP